MPERCERKASLVVPVRESVVVCEPLGVAIQQVTGATGFYDVLVPPHTATLRPLLATYRVTKQWPQPGYDLRHQRNGFRLPTLSVTEN